MAWPRQCNLVLGLCDSRRPRVADHDAQARHLRGSGHDADARRVYHHRPDHKPEQADIDGDDDDSSTGRRQDNHDASLGDDDFVTDPVGHHLADGHDSIRAWTGRARAFHAMHRWRASRDGLGQRPFYLHGREPGHHHDFVLGSVRTVRVPDSEFGGPSHPLAVGVLHTGVVGHQASPRQVAVGTGTPASFLVQTAEGPVTPDCKGTALLSIGVTGTVPSVSVSLPASSFGPAWYVCGQVQVTPFEQGDTLDQYA